MTRTQQVAWAVVVVVVLGGLYWWWSSSQGAMSSVGTYGTTTTQNNAPNIPTTQTTGQPSGSSSGVSASVSAGVSTGSTAPKTATVTFNGSSFSPSSVTIAEGGTVTFTSTAGPIWIASDPHPIHNGYDGTTMQQHCVPGYAGPAPLDECASATTWSFTFNKVGTWGYHDHLDIGVRGSVTVVAQ